ncbi:MAG: hypothetical protein MJ061_06060 [Mailhella sp.]|nr:hypothetical protein [Mailhella sp.]
MPFDQGAGLTVLLAGDDGKQASRHEIASPCPSAGAIPYCRLTPHPRIPP